MIMFKDKESFWSFLQKAERDGASNEEIAEYLEVKYKGKQKPNYISAYLLSCNRPDISIEDTKLSQIDYALRNDKNRCDRPLDAVGLENVRWMRDEISRLSSKLEKCIDSLRSMNQL